VTKSKDVLRLKSTLFYVVCISSTGFLLFEITTNRLLYRTSRIQPTYANAPTSCHMKVRTSVQYERNIKQFQTEVSIHNYARCVFI